MSRILAVHERKRRGRWLGVPGRPVSSTTLEFSHCCFCGTFSATATCPQVSIVENITEGNLARLQDCATGECLWEFIPVLCTCEMYPSKYVSLQREMAGRMSSDSVYCTYVREWSCISKPAPGQRWRIDNERRGL